METAVHRRWLPVHAPWMAYWASAAGVLLQVLGGHRPEVNAMALACVVPFVIALAALIAEWRTTIGPAGSVAGLTGVSLIVAGLVHAGTGSLGAGQRTAGLGIWWLGAWLLAVHDRAHEREARQASLASALTLLACPLTGPAAAVLLPGALAYWASSHPAPPMFRRERALSLRGDYRAPPAAGQFAGSAVLLFVVASAVAIGGPDWQTWWGVLFGSALAVVCWRFADSLAGLADLDEGDMRVRTITGRETVLSWSDVSRVVDAGGWCGRYVVFHGPEGRIRFLGEGFRNPQLDAVVKPARANGVAVQRRRF